MACKRVLVVCERIVKDFAGKCTFLVLVLYSFSNVR